jgi:anti-sigma factor RsiW
MSEHLDERLSAYLDGDLSADARAQAEAHLAACAGCRAELEGLRRLVRRAASLDDRPPERDLWTGIAARLATPGTADVLPFAPRRRFAFSVPQLAAAAVALMLLSAGSAALYLRHGTTGPATQPALTPASAAAAINVNDPGSVISSSYAEPIADLQRALDSRRGRLDTATVRVIEESLRLIDVAIRQAQDALKRDPNNRYLNDHLQRAYGSKLDLLRQAATLPVAS